MKDKRNQNNSAKKRADSDPQDIAFSSSAEQQAWIGVKNKIDQTTRAQRQSIDVEPETKNKLDQLFYKTHQKKGIFWMNSLWLVSEKKWSAQPLVGVAALLVIGMLAVPLYMLTTSREKETVRTASHKPSENKVTVDSTDQQSPSTSKSNDAATSQKRGSMRTQEVVPVQLATTVTPKVTTEPAMLMDNALTYTRERIVTDGAEEQIIEPLKSKKNNTQIELGDFLRVLTPVF